MKIFDHYRLGVVLGVIVILMFLVVTIFFLNQNYYNTSIILNAFVMPPIFVLLTLMGLLYFKRKKGSLRFREGFKFCYLNQLIGFLLSLGFIMIYMNFVSPETNKIFTYQLYDTFYQKAKQDIKDNGTIDLPKEESGNPIENSENILNYLKEQRENPTQNIFSFSSGLLLGIIFFENLFYLLNSVFLSLFLKTPKRIE